LQGPLTLGDAAGALGRYRAALALRRALLAKDADNAEARRDVSVSLGKIAEAQVATGDLVGALVSQHEALGHDEALAAADPANVDAQLDLASSLGSLAQLQARGGQARRALANAQRGLALLDALRAKQPDSAIVRRDQAGLLYQLAALQAAVGDRPAAELAWQQAQRQARNLLESYPGDAEARAVIADGCREALRRLSVARPARASPSECPVP